MSKFTRRKPDCRRCQCECSPRYRWETAQVTPVAVAAIDIRHHICCPRFTSRPFSNGWAGLGGCSVAIDQWTPESSIAALDAAAKASAVLSVSNTGSG